jgi:CDGSH-type Zn-finger protein
MSRADEVGIVRITADDEVPVRRRVNAICRCGRSASQPFCDGTHKIVPFSPRAVRASVGEGREADSPLGG